MDNTSVACYRSRSVARKSSIVVCGTINGHDYVDLGLPSGLLWATCNVGATSPSDNGGYYAWDEVITKDRYDKNNYNTTGKQMNCIAGDSTYDIARKEWGGNWRLPTKAEFQELIDNCKFEFITVNRIKGYKVTSMNNGKSMFLPTAGWCFGDMYYKQQHYGRYWSATLDESDSLCAYYLNCYDDFIDICKSYCHDGLCVRPVASK